MTQQSEKVERRCEYCADQAEPGRIETDNNGPIVDCPICTTTRKAETGGDMSEATEEALSYLERQDSAEERLLAFAKLETTIATQSAQIEELCKSIADAKAAYLNGDFQGCYDALSTIPEAGK